MTTLRQSKTTQSLVSQLAKIKEDKQTIMSKLNQEIAKNNQIIEEPIRSYRSHSQKTLVNRERSIEILQRRLSRKQEADLASDAKLDAVTLKHQRKRQQLERRLEEIAKRNANRLKQLKQIEQNMLKKITTDIQRNQVRQKHLKEEYQRIRKEEGKLRQVKKIQKKEDLQQWRVLQNEKFKVELFTYENQKRQNQLIQDRSPVPLKREERKKQEDRYIPTEKEYKKLKNVDKKDRKQVGNQYLQQVKLLHREAMVSNKKKKMMNLNLKVINYSQPIMDRIFRNTSDLSKVDKPKLPPNDIEKEEEEEQPKENPSQPTPQPTITPNKFFVLSEDAETQRYLKQIKVNLLELEKINQQREDKTKGEREEKVKGQNEGKSRQGQRVAERGVFSVTVIPVSMQSG